MKLSKKITIWALSLAVCTSFCACNAGTSASSAQNDSKTSSNSSQTQNQQYNNSNNSSPSKGDTVNDTIANAFPKNFNTIDAHGNKVDASIFSKADITVLNVWATFCGPCKNEMQELAKWASEMPENVQLVGLLTDVNDKSDSDGIDEINSILQARNADNFVNLIGNSDFNGFFRYVSAVPTTFFVDKNGNLVGTQIVGADIQNYKKELAELLK